MAFVTEKSVSRLVHLEVKIQEEALLVPIKMKLTDSEELTQEKYFLN